MFDVTEINKMDFKELRNAVQMLYDNYTKLKRMFDDAINNIDESNLATTFSKKLDSYESRFKITAKSIESMVSYDDLENNLRQYSTIKQTADEIKMVVSKSQEYADGIQKEMSAEFSMTADRISTKVVNLDNTFQSSISQTAEAIETLVQKKIVSSFESDVMPTDRNTSDSEKEKICVYGGKEYYFNKITSTWREYTDSVSSAFKQTADGFELNGCVSISGDLITDGTISGIDIAGVRFCDSDKYAALQLEASSSHTDMYLYNYDTGKEIFGIYDGISSITMRLNGKGFITYGATGKIIPEGTWDFSQCNVTGLGGVLE